MVNIEQILDYFKNTPADFVICGGDWLKQHKKSAAIIDLGLINDICEKDFEGKLYNCYGNHDDNVQGELDATDDLNGNDGRIDNQAVINLLFRQYGKTYYSFMGNNTRFYILDTGNTGHIGEGWNQVHWLAQQLIDNDDEHSIIVLHMFSDSSSDISQSIFTMAEQVTLLCQAYNNHTSITMDNQTHNFSDCTGKMNCILTGHTHFDDNIVHNGIPVICTTTTTERESETGDYGFDLVVCDYSANKLNTIRVGVGNNRSITI
jgi:predicted phosphodiesterase